MAFRAGTSGELTKADEIRLPNNAAAADGKSAAAVLSIGTKQRLSQVTQDIVDTFEVRREEIDKAKADVETGP